jgi:hypothetical protein
MNKDKGKRSSEMKKILLAVLLFNVFACIDSTEKKCRIILKEEEKAMMAQQNMPQATSQEQLMENTVKSYNEAIIRQAKLYDIVFEKKTKKEDLPLVTVEDLQSGMGLLTMIGGAVYKNEIAKYYATFCR